ncbi:hypothetical protein DPMN_024110 [Dreissena polymorpha]|uniref:Uncharacterized protein n=1 Tax=Dreissena polymorpha TaxID=45954 RepID=A0A9D4RC01_DREPO|nr:hypothetical protein DPMN_024110 [Dreissena polymorpha]
MHPIRQDNLSHGTSNGKEREGGLETPGAGTWMQMLSRWAKHGGSWRDSPRTDTPRESWFAAYAPDGTTGEDEMNNIYLQTTTSDRYFTFPKVRFDS